MDGRQLREHLGVGGVPALVLLHRGQFQHLEEDVGQLLGGTQVEGLAGQLVNLGRETVHLGLGLAPQRLQALRVDGGAHALHDGEHPHERQVDVGVGVPAAVLLQRLLQEPLQQSGRRGADGRPLGVGFGLGQRGGGQGLHERVVGVGGKRRVQHVARHGQVEAVGREHLPIAHESRLGGVGRVHPVQLRLHIQGHERAFPNHLGEQRQRVVSHRDDRCLVGGERAGRPLVEQRHLLRIDEGDADGLPRLHGPGDLGRAGVPLEHRRHFQLRLARGRLGIDHGQQPGQGARQLVLAERLLHVRRVEGGKAHRLQVEGEVQIGHDGRDLSGQKRRLAVVLDVLLLLALELPHVLVDALHRPVGLQKLRGGLGSDAGHAGDVVGAVAHKPQVVDELGGRHAVALLHLGRPVDGHVRDALLRGHDARQLARQLVGVLVAGDEQGLVSQRLVAGGNGAQNVVALPAGHLHHGDGHGLEQLLNDGKLHVQLLVHGRPLCLVLGHGLDAVHRLAGVEGAHHRVRRGHFDELAEHGEEAEDGVGGGAVLGGHGRLHRMVGTMHERVSVDNGNLF